MAEFSGPVLVQWSCFNALILLIDALNGVRTLL
jgi:hypothetical protein